MEDINPTKKMDDGSKVQMLKTISVYMKQERSTRRYYRYQILGTEIGVIGTIYVSKKVEPIPDRIILTDVEVEEMEEENEKERGQS